MRPSGHAGASGTPGTPPTVRLVWGLDGALAAAGPGAGARGPVFVVVDVLSFSTAVSVACDRGIEVVPFGWGDPAGARRLADRIGAVTAGPRDGRGPSLSPAGIRAARNVRLVVLPSPNGGAICRALGDAGQHVVVGCLRNATATGRHLRAAPDRPGVVVVAAGELQARANRSLRAAEEDLWGAGAVLAALLDHRPGRPEPLPAEPAALAAVAAFRAARAKLRDRLLGCRSGVELAEAGWARDVDVAAEVDASGVVPRLLGGRFVGRQGAARGRGERRGLVPDGGG